MEDNKNNIMNAYDKKDDGELKINKGLFAILIIALILSLCGNSYLFGIVTERYGGCITCNDINPDTPRENVDYVFKDDEEYNIPSSTGVDEIFIKPYKEADNTEILTPDDGYSDEDFDYNIDNSVNSRYGNDYETKNYNENIDEYLYPEGKGYLDIMGINLYEWANYNGVSQEDITKDGVFIISAPENGSFYEAGGQEGDVIIDIEGNRVVSIEDIKNVLSEYNPGDTVEVTYYRISDNIPIYRTIYVTLSNGDVINSR